MILSPDGGEFGVLKVEKTTPAVSDKCLAPLTLMLAHASGRETLPDGERGLLVIAMMRDEVTADEAFNAFWHAYKNKYVSHGRIQYCHLWEYISERRSGEKLYTYHEMRVIMDKEYSGIKELDVFEVVREVKDKRGKPMWRKL